MEEENGESEKEFPGLYTSEPSYRSDSDYNENSHEKGKKELLRSKKKEKNKDKGYAALDAESSGEEMEYLDIKNPLKSRRPKSFKFLQKKDKDEKDKEEKKEDKKKKERDEKDDKKKEKKKEKEEKKLREKEEKKKIKKGKKKKSTDEGFSEENCPIFGIPLSIAVERSPSHDGVRLPAIVRECIDFVEEKGLNCEGIYRLGGVKSKVQSLRRAYNSGDVVDFEDQQPHVVASLLKQYLRELPETILTVDMMPHFEDVSLIPNPRERAEAMRQLIDRLPTTNRLLLQYVLKHMGHVIEREKETKMSYHNVCVVLSPTMQISHRVLNVMFHSHQYLFGNVQIKRYVTPITSYSGAKRSLEDLETFYEIDEEIKKQESLLASLHAAIAAGRISQKKEEQLWEAQRIVTLLKRKLKSVQRKESGDGRGSHLSSLQEKDLSSEESQKEGVCPPTKRHHQSSTPPENEEEEADKNNSSSEVKSGSETDTAETSSFKTASSNDVMSRKSSEEEGDKSQLLGSAQTKGEIPPSQKGHVIPILPKPLSARAERSKLAQTGREKQGCTDSSVPSKKRDDTGPFTPEKLPLHLLQELRTAKKTVPLPPTVYQNIDFPSKMNAVDPKRQAFDKDPLQRVNKMSEIIEDEVSDVQRHQVRPTKERKPATKANVFEIKRSSADPSEWRLKAPPAPTLSETSDYSLLARENARLSLEHQELLSMNQELTRKLQAEKTEISRLRDEIQEMQTLYGYRTHSYDSSESEGSESEGESDNEEEILKQIISIDKSSQHVKADNTSLTKRIQDEREVIIRLRVALRQAQIENKMPQQIVRVC